MTERTHDLFAFTLLNIILVTQTVPNMSVATAVMACGSTFIGGLIPDIDQPTNGFWQILPAGSIVGRIVQPFLGSHRVLSHSLLGMALICYLLKLLLTSISSIVLVDMTIVWYGFIIGYASHLIADSLTKEGVPWLFPIPVRLGIPPWKALRVTTGGMIEKGLLFPGLLILNGYLVYTNYPHYVQLLHTLK